MNNWPAEKTLLMLQNFVKVLVECPELTLIGNPILRSACQEVELEEGREIAEKLKATLLKNRNITGYGRGLAAPQIGLSKRVFVTYVGDTFQTYINPIILETSKTKNLYKELCLSCGCHWADIERPEWILIQYTNELGEIKQEKNMEFVARLIQHEEDHLNGVLSLDKAVSKTIEFVNNDPLQEKLRPTQKE